MSDNVVQFPGGTLSPKELLDQLTEEIDDVEAMIVLKIDKEHNFDMGVSRMDSLDIAYMKSIFGAITDRILLGEV